MNKERSDFVVRSLVSHTTTSAHWRRRVRSMRASACGSVFTGPAWRCLPETDRQTRVGNDVAEWDRAGSFDWFPVDRFAASWPTVSQSVGGIAVDGKLCSAADRHSSCNYHSNLLARSTLLADRSARRDTERDQIASFTPTRSTSLQYSARTSTRYILFTLGQ